MNENELSILNNLVKTLREYEDKCYRQMAFMNEHNFEIEREAIRYKQQAFNCSWLEVSSAIDKIMEIGRKRGEQKHSVWSEEDERNLKGIIDEIEANKNNAPDYDLATYDRFLSWLKSLKQRVEV